MYNNFGDMTRNGVFNVLFVRKEFQMEKKLSVVKLVNRPGRKKYILNGTVLIGLA